MAIVIPEIWQASVGNTQAFATDCKPWLATGELVASLTLTEIDTSDLTITQVAVSTDPALVVLRRTIPVGEAVQCLISGMLVGVEYKLSMTLTTDSSPAQVLVFCQKMQTADAC